jgi:hypothetical protein
MPSKNEIANAKVAHLARHGAEHGAVSGSITIDMTTVRRRKREMVERQIAAHLQKYKASGAELIMGSGRFVAPKTLEVILNDGGTRMLAGDKVFLDVGTHAAIPNVPGLEAAKPLTHVDALELDYLPQHLIVIGGGYSGLELAQAYLRFGSEVTIMSPVPSSWVGKMSTFPRRCGAFSATKVCEFFWRPNYSRYGGDLGTRLHLSFALPPVSKTLMAATSWSRWDAFRIPPESDFRRPASN